MCPSEHDIFIASAEPISHIFSPRPLRTPTLWCSIATFLACRNARCSNVVICCCLRHRGAKFKAVPAWYRSAHGVFSCCFFGALIVFCSLPMQVDRQKLMRVYGALMWSMGKIIRTPEVRTAVCCWSLVMVMGVVLDWIGGGGGVIAVVGCAAGIVDGGSSPRQNQRPDFASPAPCEERGPCVVNPQTCLPANRRPRPDVLLIFSSQPLRTDAPMVVLPRACAELPGS